MLDQRETLSEAERAVWARLDRVADPELDEPITALGFVERVTIDGEGGVAVDFRLPTYWCSPNFAFLMAEGIHREVGALDWVTRVRVQLHDHLCAEEMNAAVNAGRSFTEALQLNPLGGDLDEVREKFDRKAFERRQEAVLLGLRAMGFTPEAVAAMTLGQLALVGFADPTAAQQKPRYLEILTRRGLAVTDDDHAFPDVDGRPLTPGGYAARMSHLRATRINMEFGGALCRGLKQSRYREKTPVTGEPTLADFIMERVPTRS